MSAPPRDDPVMRAIEQGIGWLLRQAWRYTASVWRPLGACCRHGGRSWASLASSLAVLWAIARVDLLRWRRSPLTIACSFIPPLGMTLFLVVLSLSVTRNPVALVVNSRGAETQKLRNIITADDDAYQLTVTDARTAQRMLAQLEVAAIITIPADFDTALPRHAAVVELTLNNTDIDFADDIRRSVDRSVARFHEPALTTRRSEGWDADDGPMSFKTYGVQINEHDLRATNVDWLRYQVIPALVLLVLCVGLIGTALFCAEDVECATARYLILAPPHAWLLLAGRLLGGTLAALLALAPAVLLCLWTHVMAPPEGHWGALLAIFLATACSAAGLGAMLGALMRGARTVALAATVLSTYLFLLGGGFTTIAFLPPWLRAVSAWVPMRYAIDGLRQALFYPTLDGVTHDLYMLCGTALLALLLGAVLLRRAWVRG